MKIEDLNRLEALRAVATPGPWHVCRLDDQLCQGAIAISNHPQSQRVLSMHAGDWPGHDIIAACLIQDPPYAVIADNRFEENAALIAAVRNHLPELLRLAKLALEP
ncbi:MAG: hypothetical protein WCL10_16530 [Novosphingobium sp.]|uniref:hypothetical protein n=1 Tax=Novosphingobium sp. TaxID=1874826 RepID=UPI0030198E07